MAQDPWAEFRTGPTPAQPQQPQQPQQAQPRPVQPQQRGPVYGPPVVQTPPPGYEIGPNGVLRPITGGPADPNRPQPPTGYRPSANGGLEYIPGGPADPTLTQGATEAQAKSAQFFGRMLEAERMYSAVPAGSRDARTIFGQAFHDWMPDAENYFNSPDRQSADQAARNFIAASLRQESGAAIGQDEYNNQYRIFFPMPGDSQEVIDQKAEARRQAIEGFRIAAGPFAERAAGTVDQPPIRQVPLSVGGAPQNTQPPAGSNPTPPTGGNGPQGPRIDSNNPRVTFRPEDWEGQGENRRYIGPVWGPLTQNPDGTLTQSITSWEARDRGLVDPAEYMATEQAAQYPQDPTANMGFFESIGEAFTGNARSTPEIEALPDYAGMPEMNQFSVDSFQSALGTLFGGSPQEIAQILQSQFPSIRVRQDANGNYILRSPTDGKEYAIRPGFRASDVPRALGVAAAFTPAGRAASISGTMTASAATQAGIEATQAATGGDFSATDVAIAGGTAGVFRAAEPYVARGVQVARNALRREPAAPTDAAIGLPGSPSMQPEAPPATTVPRPATPNAAPMQQPPLTPSAQEEVAVIARQASRRGRRGAQARQQLADMARTNPEAADAARRLGMELPVDVMSDSQQVRALAGLTRSEVGSEAEAAWRETMQRTAQQADEALALLGASRDLAQVSDDVLTRMRSISDNLEAQAAPLRRQVDAAIDPATRIDAVNLQRLLGDMINDYGGIAEAKAAMTPQERSLLSMLGVGRDAIRPTYARLNRLRDDIGRALNNRQGPWVDVNEAQLRRYYNALRDDQIAAVETIGGPEIAAAQRRANDLFAEMFRQREATQEVFGQQLDRSLATIMTRAINSGRQGDAREIYRVLSRIPEDMRGQAVTSAIMAQSASRASHGGFSFANFAKTYGGLRANRPIHSQIARAIGPDGIRVLDDLLEISGRMAGADANVLRTGKANQVMVDAIRAEGIVSQVFSTATRRTGAGVGAAAGGVVGGPGGAAVGATLGESVQTALQSGSKSELQAIHSLLESEEFLALAAAGPSPATREIGRLNSSAAFNRFAAVMGLRGQARRDWLTRLAGIIANDGRGGLTANDNALTAAGVAAQPDEQQRR